ncbi:MAG: hypothetical protein U0325_22765 [Polyangiales bacterium]
MADDGVEVLYEPPRGSPRALAASWIGAGLFLLFVAWLLSHLLRSTRSMVVAGAVTAAVLVAQSRWSPGGVRATRRITADRAAKTLSFEYRGGALVLPWSEVASSAAERVTAGDGVDLAAVVIHRAGGEVLRFGVHSDAAAQGVVAGWTALRDAAG